MSLPPGPRLPRTAQTARLARDPIGYIRRCRERYGELFTLRYHPFDTLVYVCDPDAVREIFTGDPEVFRAGEANQFMEPTLGPRSVLLLDGADHLRMRKLMLPPFHGRGGARRPPPASPTTTTTCSRCCSRCAARTAAPASPTPSCATSW